MSVFTNWLAGLVDIFHAARDKNLTWRLANQAQEVELRQQQILAEKTLEAELKKKSLLLEHELTLLKTRNAAELSMLKTRCRQDIEDYRQYLASLDKLKGSLKESYSHLPEPVAFTIHHHAKSLLHQMWEADNIEEKMRCEMRLLRFMTAVHEDARRHLEDTTTETMPEKTLKLLQEPSLATGSRPSLPG
ncbi:MAG: hypothetical protein ACU841_08830 [Gammaproteobacteria bacterium]